MIAKWSVVSAVLRVCTIAAALLVTFDYSLAQSNPSPAAIATAKEIVKIRGGDALFGSFIPGDIEQAKAKFEKQNPALGKDLNIVAGKLRTELGPRIHEVNDEVAKAYASHFTESELKEMLAFYNSPVGRKMTTEEPKALAQGMNFAQEWAQKFSDVVLSKYRSEMKKLGHDI
jgi:hypothetical protein